MVLGRRGGNRLRADHPARGRAPRYKRRWSFPEDHERRDRWQRERFFKALHQAQAAGELPRHVAGALWHIAYRYADVQGEGITASLSTIARGVMGEGHYPEEDLRAGQRTARGWLQWAEDAGWMDKRHRSDHLADGTWRGRTAERRLCIPAKWRVLLEEQEDEARRRSNAAKRSGPGRTTPRGTRPPDRSRPPEPTPSEVYRRDQETREAREAAAGEADWDGSLAAIKAMKAQQMGAGDRSPP